MTRAAQRGSASVPVLVMVVVLVTAGLATAWVGGALAAQRRVQAAADLAALAGATALVGGGDGCAAASRIAGRNGATLSACRTQAAGVLVTARLRGPDLVGRELWLDAQARAGPS